MQIFLVGGAVRDHLLKRVVAERDYVVVGSSVREMLAQGYQPVGKDFPVFLHPKTKEEYALARTERKTGVGYHGFTCHASPDVTLEQDLARRDLTINAMAMAADGTLIDPFGGQGDLSGRTLRHISPAFSEDPLRVLRVARFAARYRDMGFTIARETWELMRKLSHGKELEYLSADRVWQETQKVLLEPAAEHYFALLKSIGGLSHWYKELDQLWNIPNPPKWHPEIDSGVHTLMVLKKASQLSPSLAVRIAALLHDVGKTLTEAERWPSHHGHAETGVGLIKAFCSRLRVNNEYRDLAISMSKLHCKIHRIKELSANQILSVFNDSDAWRKPRQFEQLLLTCEADFLGRKGFARKTYHPRQHWLTLLAELNEIKATEFVAQQFTGPQIKEAMNRAKITKIEQYIAKQLTVSC